METSKFLAMINLISRMRGLNDHLPDLINDLPDNIVMAEVGCYAGQSTLMFLQSDKIKKLYAIDPWKNKLEGQFEDITPQQKKRRKNMYAEMPLAEKSFDFRILPFIDIVVKLKMTLKEAFNNLPELDFIYIDADHRYGAVLNDINLSKKIVKKGGIIGGHDYSKAFPGVIKAVNESFEKIDKIYIDTSWIKLM